MNPNHGIRNLVFFFSSISSSSQSHAHHISTHLEYENSENLKKRKTNNRRRKKRKGKTHGRPKNRRLFFDCIAVSWNSTNTVSSNFVDIFFLFIFSPPNRNRLSNIKRYSVLAFCTRVHSSKVLKGGGNKQRVFRYSRKACRPRKKKNNNGKTKTNKKKNLIFLCNATHPCQTRYESIHLCVYTRRMHGPIRISSAAVRYIDLYLYIYIYRSSNMNNLKYLRHYGWARVETMQRVSWLEHLRATSIGVSSIRSDIDICSSCKNTCSVRNDHVSNPIKWLDTETTTGINTLKRQNITTWTLMCRSGVGDRDTGVALQTEMCLATIQKAI